MPEFQIYYTKLAYYTCTVEAQNEDQVRYLFEHDMLELDNESFGDSKLDKIRSIEKVG